MENNKKVILEIFNIYRAFFSSGAIKDKLIEAPTEVKKLGTKLGVLSVLLMCVGLSFAFFLQLTSMMIDAKYIGLGIMFFMLYQGERVVNQAVQVYVGTEKERYDNIFEDELTVKATSILEVLPFFRNFSVALKSQI